MGLTKYPRFSKGSWVQVMHPNHKFFERVGKVAVSGPEASEVDFKEGTGTIRKPFMNTALQKAETPRQLEEGEAVVVTDSTSPHYLRRGVVHALNPLERIAMVDMGDRKRDTAGKPCACLLYFDWDDLEVLHSPSSGTDKGDRKLRSAQG